MTQSFEKLRELDAVRGLAALAVFNSHFLYTFLPSMVETLRPTPLFAALNGGSAVMVFFVLSGFVLTLQPLRQGQVIRLAAPVLRRWPRLAGPVVVAGLLYIVAARTGAFPKAAWFAGAGPGFPQGLLWGRYLDDAQVGPVLAEAAFGAFFRGEASHNLVLWTMIWELRGSLVAFAIALCLLLPIPAMARIAGACVLTFVAWRASPWLVGFPIGVAAAYAHVHYGNSLRLPVRMAVPIGLLALPVLAWDFGQAAGMWTWTEQLATGLRFYIWAASESIAALAVMATALYCPPVRRALNTRPARFLGALSFPLYLTHLLTILSFGAWTCFAIFPSGVNVPEAAVLYVPVLGACFAVAWPVLAFDRWWVRTLAVASNRGVQFVVMRLSPVSPSR